MSRIVDPFVGLFVATATLNAAILIPLFLLLRDDVAQVKGEVADIRAPCSPSTASGWPASRQSSRRRKPNTASGWRSWRPGKARCAAIWR